MFNLEIIELTNSYKNSQSDYDKANLKTSLINLISQNKEQYDNFIEKYSNQIDEQTNTLLTELETQIKNRENTEQTTQNQEQNNQNQNTTNTNPQENNIKKISNYFQQWNENYSNNSNQPNENCNQIVQEIINTYAQNQYNIIEKILEIENGDNYEKFKWHIKNNLRIYFISQVQNYLTKQESKDEEEKLNFLEQYKKKRMINKLLDDIENYKFDRNYMNEVLK